MAHFRISRRVLHQRFLSILPRIRLHARIFFRHLRCWHTKEDRIAETVDLCWKWFVGLARRGKDARQFASTLASFAAKAVNSGRRLCGQLKAKDVLSERAQQRHHFVVGKLPDFSTESTNPLTEALADNTVSPVPDQVHFRLDFPAWLRTRTARDRRIIGDMLLSTRTKDLAYKHGVSQGRISQMRRDFQDDWHRFTDDTPEHGIIFAAPL